MCINLYCINKNKMNGSQAPKKSGLSIKKDYKTGKHVTFKPAQNKKGIK